MYAIQEKAKPRSVEIALLENTTQDAYDFRFTPALWKAAVAESNFVSAQEELRIVMTDEFEG